MRLGLLRLLAGISAGVVACAAASGGISRGEEGAASTPPLRKPLPMRGGLPASERPIYGGTLRMELGELAEPRGPGFMSPLDESAMVLMQLVYEIVGADR